MTYLKRCLHHWNRNPETLLMLLILIAVVVLIVNGLVDLCFKAMKIPLAIFSLLGWIAAAADIGVVTETAGVGIESCHAGDRALVEVIPDRGAGGSFVTTNRTLFLRDLTMLPGGTNLLRIRTICQGTTSAVTEARIVIRRPVPAPHVYRVDLSEPKPPVPPGMAVPLPQGEKVEGYAEWRRRVESGKRRSE